MSATPGSNPNRGWSKASGILMNQSAKAEFTYYSILKEKLGN
jgi:hypothetical protein